MSVRALQMSATRRTQLILTLGDHSLRERREETRACRDRSTLSLTNPWAYFDRVSKAAQLNVDTMNARCGGRDTKPSFSGGKATPRLLCTCADRWRMYPDKKEGPSPPFGKPCGLGLKRTVLQQVRVFGGTGEPRI
jgi:hypothetical protein